MAEPRIKPLAVLEGKARHGLLMVGFGFLAFAGGGMLSAALVVRLQDRLAGAPAWVIYPVGVAVQQLWVLAVLPALAYLCARLMTLRPWPTAVVAGVTGELFVLALAVATVGTEGLLQDPLHLAVQLSTVLVGIAFTAWSVKRGRQWAAARDLEAKAAAEARRGQYDEFLKASQALADQRDQQPTAPPQGPGEAPGPGKPST